MSPKEKIALLNDKARKGLLPESTRVFLTRRVAALPDETISSLRRTAAEFDGFNEDNDPYREHGFGAVEPDGERYFWKIDYYDRTLRFGAEDPTEASETTRELRFMHASEY